MKSTGKPSKPIIAANSTKHSGTEPAPPDAKSTGKRRVSRVPGNGMRTQVLERISDGILAFDAQMNHVYVDERAGELLGREPKTLVGKNFWEEYPNSTGTPFADACQRAFETQTVVPFDGYFAPTNSWFEGRIYPSTDGLSVLISDRGLPDQEDMIHALEKSEEKFSKAFHTSPIAKAIIRIHDRSIIDINQSFLKLFEFEDREVIGKMLPDLGLSITPAWREVITRVWKQKGSIQQQEMAVKIRSGETRHILLSVDQVELDKEACWLVSAMDITERKQAEERVREISEFPLQNPNPIMRFTRGGELLFANPAATRLLDLWKQTDGTLALPNEVQEALQKAAETRTNTQIELDATDKNYICLFVPVPDTNHINLYLGDITQHKQTQESLQALIHQTTTGITRIDLDGRYLFVNQAFCDLVGYSASELIHKSIWDINHQDDMAKSKRLFESMVTEGEAYQIEKRFIRRNGHVLWVNVGTSPLRDARGRVYAAVSVIVDITRRKRAEESLLESARRTLYVSTLSDTLRQLTTPLQIESEAPVILASQLKASRVAYVRISPNGTAIVRKSYADGIPGLPGEFALDRFIPRDALHRLQNGQTFVMSGSVEPHITPPPADPVHAQIVVPLTRDGALVAVLFIQQSEKRTWKPEEVHLAEETAERIQSAIERAHTQRDLLESEKRFRILANTVPSMVWSTAPNGTVIYLNERWFDYTGLTEEQSISNWANLTVHPDDYDRCMQAWDHSLTTGEEYRLEMRYRRHDGEYRWFQSHAIPARDEDGNITTWHGVTTDIHERVQKEAELQEVINQTPFMLTRCTRDLHYRFVSRAYAEMLGLTPKEVAGRPIVEIMGEPGLQTIAPYVEQVLTGERVEYETDVPFKGVGTRSLHVIYMPDINEKGEVAGWFASITDVSERKRTDEQLRELSQRLSYHVDNSPLAVIEWGSDMRLIRWSGAAERIFGWKAEEVLGKRMEDLRWIYEEDIPQVDDVSGDLQTGADPHRFSANRNYRKDGSVAYCEWYNSSLLDEAGNLRSILSLVLDVTDRKQAEEQRERSNQKLNEILASIQDDLFVLDRQWNFVYASSSFTSKLGKQPEDLVGGNVWMLLPKHANTDLEDNFRAAMEKREVRRFEVRGKYTDAWYRLTAFPSAEGITVLGTDITERKHAEDELRARTEEIETLMEVSPIGIYVAHDPQCKHISGNPAAYSLVQMPADSYGNISKSAPEEEQPAYRVFRNGVELEPEQLPMQAAAQLGKEIEEETLELRFENGSRRYVYVYAKPLFDADGRVRGAVAAMLDVTERKKNEEALRLDATIMENVPAGVYLVRASDESIIHTNRTFDRLFGYEPGEIIGKHVSAINAPTDHSPQEVAAEIIEILTEKGSWQGEVYSRRKNGSAFWTYANVISFEHATYGPVWVAARQDISERKRTEEELRQLNLQLETRVQNRTAELQAAYEFLRQSEATARLILESMPDAILVTDKKGRIVYGNTQVESLFGYSPDEVMGKPVEILIPDRYRGGHLEFRAHYALERERRNIGLNRDLYGLRKDNSEFPVDVMLSPISNNTTWDVMITIRDNTQQKQAREALRANEEKLRRLFEILPVGISFIDNEDRISEMNTALTQILGLSKSELMEGKYKPRRYIRADGTPMPPSEFASSRARAEQKPIYNVETGVIKEDGSIVWTSVSATPVDVADVDVVIATIDITERKKAEDALHKHRERLRTLSRRLVEVQEDERRAIAHELHDRVGQNLAALNLNLNILRSQLSTETLQLIGTRLDDSVSLVNQILTITRNVMADLRSNVLDDYGLELALREYTDKFTQRTGIQVGFDKTGKALPRLDPNIEMTLLRIAQEALTNVSRHAQADHVSIATSVDQDAVYMSIEDNGIGILSWQKANQSGSHGLRIIRERAEAFGGSLQVHSAYKKGTRIEVRIPLGSTGSLKSKMERRS